jgi:tape measure domain-containing protein
VSTIGYATMPIIPSLRGMDRQIQSQLGGLNTAAAQAGSRAGESLTSRFGGAVRNMAASAGRVLDDMFTGAAIAGGGLLATSLFRGWDRLTTIQDSTAALTIALGDATAAGQLLDDVLDVVRGTPFNLDQFARGAQQLVGFGVEAEKVPGYLTAIGEASATQGRNAGQFADRLITVFGQIAAKGRIQLGDVWRISETGVNALAILANHFGVTTDAMQDMISSGAVPAGEALDALASGILEGSDGVAGSTVALAGTMAGLRETLSGAAGGFGAAMSRFGASILEPFSESLVVGFGAAADLLDELGGRIGDKLSELVESPGFQRFSAWVRDMPNQIGPLLDRLSGLGPALAPLAALFASRGIAGLAGMLGPLGRILPVIGPIPAILIGIVAASPELREALGELLVAFGSLAEVVAPLLADLGGRLAPVISTAAGLVATFASQAASAIERFSDTAKREGFSEAFAEIGRSALGAWPGVQAGLEELARNIATWVSDVVPRFMANLQVWTEAFFGWLGPAIPPALRELGRLIGALLEWILDEGLPLLVESLIDWTISFVSWIAPAIPPILLELGKLLLQVARWIVVDAVPTLVLKLVEWAAAFAGWVMTEGLPRLIWELATLINNVVAWILGPGKDGILDVGKRFGRWVLDGITSVIDGLIQWMQELPGRIADGAREFFREAGRAMGEQFAKGFREFASDPLGMGSVLKGAFRDLPWWDPRRYVGHSGGVLPGGNNEEVQLTALGGEMVLTRQQQSNLFGAIASGSIGGGRGDGLHIENLHIGTHDDLIEARSKLAMLAIQMGA